MSNTCHVLLIFQFSQQNTIWGAVGGWGWGSAFSELGGRVWTQSIYRFAFEARACTIHSNSNACVARTQKSYARLNQSKTCSNIPHIWKECPFSHFKTYDSNQQIIEVQCTVLPADSNPFHNPRKKKESQDMLHRI